MTAVTDNDTDVMDTLSTSFSKATYTEKVKAATSCVKEQFKPEITQEKIT